MGLKAWFLTMEDTCLDSSADQKDLLSDRKKFKRPLRGRQKGMCLEPRKNAGLRRKDTQLPPCQRRERGGEEDHEGD